MYDSDWSTLLATMGGPAAGVELLLGAELAAGVGFPRMPTFCGVTFDESPADALLLEIFSGVWRLRGEGGDFGCFWAGGEDRVEAVAAAAAATEAAAPTEVAATARPPPVTDPPPAVLRCCGVLAEILP